MSFHDFPWFSMSFHEFPWVSMIFHDFHEFPWFSTIFHDFPWFSMIFHDFPWFSMSFHDFPGFSRIFHDFPRFSWIFHDFPWFSMIFHDFPWVSMIFHDFPGFSTIFQDFPGFSKIFQDFPGFSMIFLEINLTKPSSYWGTPDWGTPHIFNWRSSFRSNKGDAEGTDGKMIIKMTMKIHISYIIIQYFSEMTWNKSRWADGISYPMGIYWPSFLADIAWGRCKMMWFLRNDYRQSKKESKHQNEHRCVLWHGELSKLFWTKFLCRKHDCINKTVDQMPIRAIRSFLRCNMVQCCV